MTGRGWLAAGAVIVVAVTAAAWQYSFIPAITLAAGVGTACLLLLVNGIWQWRATMKARQRRAEDWLEGQMQEVPEYGEAPDEDEWHASSDVGPAGGAEARRCSECGRYNLPDADRCTWCLGQHLSERTVRPPRTWDPDTRSGKVLFYVVVLVAWGGALAALNSLAGVGGFEAARGASGVSNVPLALRAAAVAYIAGTIGLIGMAGLWRQFSTAFGRSEDLAQMIGVGLLTFIATVAAGWLMLLAIA